MIIVMADQGGTYFSQCSAISYQIDVVCNVDAIVLDCDAFIYVHTTK